MNHEDVRYLLYTSDREHGGFEHLGIFKTEEEAWDCYQAKYPDPGQRYWNVPHIEPWRGDKRVVVEPSEEDK